MSSHEAGCFTTCLKDTQLSDDSLKKMVFLLNLLQTDYVLVYLKWMDALVNHTCAG